MNKHFKISTLLLTFACFQVSILFGQTNKNYSKEIEEKITQVESNLIGAVQIENIPPVKWTLAERMKFYHANGISITVIKDYKIEWTKSYGWADSLKQRPVTAITRFQAGSNSKSLNAIGVLKLVQDGKVNLNEDINKYLKTWKFPYDTLSKGKKITVANLLSHTAGITIHGFPGYEIGDTIPTLTQILDGQKPANTKAVRSIYEPSLKYQYSGGGTTISQLIIQDVTGQPYDEYMWNNVLKPMGMTNSSYTQPPTKKVERFLATGYYNDGKPVKGKYHIYPEQAAAGLWTTSNDLAKYVIETQLSLEAKSKKVLNRETTMLRLTPFVDSSSALGIFIFNKGGVKYFNHGGVDEGFVSQYVGSFEGGNGVVVMTNTYNTALYNEIIYSVASTYKWKNYSPEVRKTTTPPDTLIASYSGKYILESDTLAIIKKSDGIYIDDLTEKTSWKIYFTDNTNFFVLENRMKFGFQIDNISKSISLKINNWVYKKLE
jgi:CubicO group peptidase (beta-lactamase class C family)